MTIQTKLVGRAAKLRVVSRTVRVVTIEASNSTPVHHALHEIIALHSILVRGPIRKMIKVLRFAEGVILKLPVILELDPHPVTDRPIVILALNGIRYVFPFRR
jgi:hypothetical protein